MAYTCIETKRERDRLYTRTHREENTKRYHDWYAANREHRLAWLREYRKSPQVMLRHHARAVVAEEITARHLELQPCEVCGTLDLIEAHHDDYTRPLDVRWLCKRHHHDLHVAERESNRAKPKK